jgi:hypothetical protein
MEMLVIVVTVRLPEIVERGVYLVPFCKETEVH